MSYEDIKFEENVNYEAGGNNMNDTNFGSLGAVGGLIGGGILGYLVGQNSNNNNHNGNCGHGCNTPVPIVSVPQNTVATTGITELAILSMMGKNPGCTNDVNCYSPAEVSNLMATKDAQFAQLTATSTAENAIISRVDGLGLELCKGLATVAADNTAQITNARIEAIQANNNTNLLIAENSAKAELCCCKTQGLIKESALESQNFYLKDQVDQLRLKDLKTASGNDITIINQNINQIAGVVSSLTQQVANLATKVA